MQPHAAFNRVQVIGPMIRLPNNDVLVNISWSNQCTPSGCFGTSTQLFCIVLIGKVRQSPAKSRKVFLPFLSIPPLAGESNGSSLCAAFASVQHHSLHLKNDVHPGFFDHLANPPRFEWGYITPEITGKLFRAQHALYQGIESWESSKSTNNTFNLS